MVVPCDPVTTQPTTERLGVVLKLLSVVVLIRVATRLQTTELLGGVSKLLVRVVVLGGSINWHWFRVLPLLILQQFPSSRCSSGDRTHETRPATQLIGHFIDCIL